MRARRPELSVRSPERRSFAAACLAGLAAGCGPTAGGADATAGAPAATPATPAPRVVMLGDSLTAGYGLRLSQALPAVVERRLEEAGIAAEVVNAGVSGDTTADALNRYEFSVGDLQPDLVVIALGANDFLNGYPPETPRANLAELIGLARADAPVVALLGVELPGAPPAFGPRLAAYAAIYPELARDEGVPLMPSMLEAVTGRPELLMPDGVHPTAEGVEAIAADVADFLAPLVREAAASRVAAETSGGG
jgi:acyl-CoA thioesterase-1